MTFPRGPEGPDDDRYGDDSAHPGPSDLWEEEELALTGAVDPEPAPDPEPATPAEPAASYDDGPQVDDVLHQGSSTPMAEEEAPYEELDEEPQGQVTAGFHEQMHVEAGPSGGLDDDGLDDTGASVEPVYDDAVYDAVYLEDAAGPEERADDGAAADEEGPVEELGDEPGADQPFDTAPQVAALDDDAADDYGPDDYGADDGADVDADAGAGEDADSDREGSPGEALAVADGADSDGEPDRWVDDELEGEEELDRADDADPHPVAAGSGRGPVTALALLVVALLLLGGYLGYAVSDSRGVAPIEATRSSALDAGRDAARVVFSYDYRHLDKDFAAASAVTTGTFKSDYANTTKKLVGDVAPRYKAVLVAEVSEAGVIRASEDEVQLLVFMDVQSTSTLAATPKITPRRLKMTMTRVDDRWLVSKVDAF